MSWVPGCLHQVLRNMAVAHTQTKLYGGIEDTHVLNLVSEGCYDECSDTARNHGVLPRSLCLESKDI